LEKISENRRGGFFLTHTVHSTAQFNIHLYSASTISAMHSEML